jgi:hypothetical protein
MPELPNIVRERLKVSRPTADHPDADALTAFAEHGLPEPERAVIAEHLARCHDCRDVLVLALPAAVTVEIARVPLPARGGWLRAPVLRWGVVAAGLAVFAVIGLLQYQQRNVRHAAIAARDANAPIAEVLTARASRTGESAKAAPGAPSTLAEPANAVPANVNRVNAGPAIASNAYAPFKKERAFAAPRNEPSALSASGLPSHPGLAAALPLHGSASSRAPGILNVEGPLNQTPSYRKASPSSADKVETQSQLVAANTPDEATSRAFMDVTVDKAKAPATTAAMSAGSPVLETETASPSPSAAAPALRWAISATGGLLRSFDQGNTWTSVDVKASVLGTGQMVMAVPQAQKNQQAAQQTTQQATQFPAPNQAQGQAPTKMLGKVVSQQRAAVASGSIPFFRAISAAGLEVWAGGSAGVLYHSADGGEQWTRVAPSASGILLTGDILGIAFNDPQRGQVTTSTQELWTTSDAGQTWQKQ